MKPIFNELQIDVFKEYINVSFGAATSNIAILLDSFASLKIPKIEIIKATELEEHIRETIGSNVPKYLAQQVFNGDLGGETVFIADNISVQNLASHLHKDTEITQKYINDAILELNNILSVTTIGKLSEITGLVSEFMPPTLKIIELDHFLEKSEIEKYPSVIVISTVMVFEDEEIEGHLFILTTDDMIQTLKSVINKQIKEQFPDYE